MTDIDDNRKDDIERDAWADAFFSDVVKKEERQARPVLYGQFEDEGPDAGAVGPEGGDNRDIGETESAEPASDGSVDGGPDKNSGDLTSDEKTTIALVAVGIVLLILIILLCGIFIGKLANRVKENDGKSSESAAFESRGASQEQIKKLEEIFEFIYDNYYLETDPNELIEGAVAGMAAVIEDPYGSYYRPGKMNSFLDYVRGRHTGIGTYLESNGEGFLVTEVERGSPAESAGISPGDMIVEIDGEKTAGLDEGAAESFFSRPDSTFTIVIKSGEEYRTVTCSNEKLKKKAVFGEDLGSGIIYIRITQFGDGVKKDFEEVLGGLKTENVRGLILDLRDNPGGYVAEAVGVADILLPEGVVSVSRNRSGEVVETYSSKKGSAGLEIAVIVNGGTASAAELLTGAIRDFGAGKVIGVRTYGKAVGQIMKTFDHDGSGISLSAYRFYTPSGDCIEGEGITPDETVLPYEGFEQAKASDLSHENDAQLRAALLMLEEKGD